MGLGSSLLKQKETVTGVIVYLIRIMDLEDLIRLGAVNHVSPTHYYCTRLAARKGL